MKLLFIIDPIQQLKSYKDTSIAMMRAAAARGHALFVCEQHDFYLQQATVHIRATALTLQTGESWYQLGTSEDYLPSAFDAVLMRKDPPFDNEYLYSTYLLELASQQGARVLNNPTAIRSWNEKLSVAKFPQFAPEFLVTNSNARIRDFLAHHHDIVVKPLDGMGGSGIFRLTEQDPNIGAILETVTEYEQRTIMAQRYLPAIKQGDKRILVIHGAPAPYALARIPKPGETRGNLAAGGKGVAQPLTERDWEIARTVGQSLKAEGLFLVGLDVIGEHLTEINVTSPTGMVEIATQTDCNPAQLWIEALESIVALEKIP
ncbi:glutathione synthase [Methylotenera sp. 1P/1]|uniref:glutathione synthase n=1 Tax=Methylotenera sp. 1P/1 TaxID=1131551 RepID=UPI0003668F7C|nr:glutathione synthase [Methylotenera sp. 1P/1]